MNLEITRNILIAVDDSPDALRAVSYVGQLLGGIKGFNITILHVISEPDEDYFPKQSDKDIWLNDYIQHVDRMLEKYRNILIDTGFDPQDVLTRSTVKFCHSMAECILAERDDTEYSTLVIGRKGLSPKEEFLFGSISGKIVRIAKNCTVWVVQ